MNIWLFYCALLICGASYISMEKLSQLRAYLKSEQIDCFLLPITDEYLNEYCAPNAMRVEWLCGFDGSAGTLVIDAKNATLFTDGRYILQAAKQLDSEHFSVINSGEQKISEFLQKNLLNGGWVGFDGLLHSVKQIEALQAECLGLNFKSLSSNPIDSIWQERPSAPANPVFLHDEKFAGISSAAKIQQVIAQMSCDNLLINEADCICWLLNIRGDDIEYNPIPHARAILRNDGSVTLFIAPEKMQGLDLGNVEIVAEMQMMQHLSAIKGNVQLCASATPYYFAEVFAKNNIEVKHAPNPIMLLKAVKSATEIEGMKRAHIIDGIAVTNFINWFNGLADDEIISELDVCAKLAHFRAQQPDYRGPSFATIAGSGANGAIVHYRADEKTNRNINNGDVLLLDSGGQYPYGTTDITRTLVRGNPSEQFKQHFTLVLKGHIALACAIFPYGTTGHQLDVLARQYLWAQGLDYAHGTGHGVGSYLCVHEGPQGISPRPNNVALKAGMIISNEPAYYVQGEYGIRIESLILVVEKMKVAGVQYLGFETITRAPIDEKLINFNMLSAEEKAWLQNYNYYFV